jgi:hypothetical protein
MGEMQNKNTLGFGSMAINNQQLEVGIEIWC